MDWFVMWKDKRVEDLSREELMEALRFSVARLREYESPGANRARSLGRVEMMKRGERYFDADRTVR